MHAQERRYVSNSQPNDSSGLNIHLATNRFSWPMLNDSRNQSRTVTLPYTCRCYVTGLGLYIGILQKFGPHANLIH